MVDNVSIHTAKAVHKWQVDHQRLQLVYLFANAGHKYNPAEKIWWYLKDKVSANRSFKLLIELDHAIRRNLEALTPAHILKLINSPVTRQAQAALVVQMETVLYVGCSRARNHLVVLVEDELPTATRARLSATI